APGSGAVHGRCQRSGGNDRAGGDQGATRWVRGVIHGSVLSWVWVECATGPVRKGRDVLDRMTRVGAEKDSRRGTFSCRGGNNRTARCKRRRHWRRRH